MLILDGTPILPTLSCRTFYSPSMSSRAASVLGLARGGPFRTAFFVMLRYAWLMRLLSTSMEWEMSLRADCDPIALPSTGFMGFLLGFLRSSTCESLRPCLSGVWECT